MRIKEAVEKASPVLMEPVMDAEVMTPQEIMGEVIRDKYRGRGVGFVQTGAALGPVASSAMGLIESGQRAERNVCRI